MNQKFYNSITIVSFTGDRDRGVQFWEDSAGGGAKSDLIFTE